MDIISFIKNLFTIKISDEEIAEHDWILCPKCNVNITKEDIEDNNWICPNCKTKIIQG